MSIEEKVKKPIRTVAFMMGATVLSKVLGMLRSVLLASHYGTGSDAAAFSAASRIPLSFFDMLFSAAILGCFIPAYNSFAAEKRKEASDFACGFLNLVMLGTGVFSLIGILFAPQIISLISPGLDAGTAATAAILLRIMFPMVIFTGTVYTLVGLLQSKGSYLLPALVSSISNGGVIIYFLLFDNMLGENGVYGLAVSYLVAWFIQLVTMAVPLIRGGGKYRPVLNLKDPVLLRSLKMSVPIMVGSWLAPVGLMVGTYFAPLMVANGNVIFDYANNVYTIIAGILTYSICNYVFPLLSRMSAQGDEAEFYHTVRNGLISALAIMIPCMAAAMILGREGIALLYMRGQFDASSAQSTAATFRLIAVAMPAFALIEIINRVFYAKKMAKIPMFAALCGVAVNIGTSALFLAADSGFGVGAIGLSYALGQISAAAVLTVFMVKYMSGVFNKDFFRNLIKLVISGLICGAVMMAAYGIINNDPYVSGMIRNIAVSAGISVTGLAVYAVLLKLLRVDFKAKQEVSD